MVRKGACDPMNKLFKDFKRMPAGDKVFHICNTILMILLCALFIYPFLYVASRSLMPESERVLRPFALIPHSLDFSGYQTIFAKGSNVINAYGVTILRTVVGTGMNLIFTILTAYVLSRRDYPLRTFLTVVMAFTMWFGGGLIPTYLVNQAYGLGNNFWVYILPGLISPWNTLIMRNFFAEIPVSLHESARIDGATEMTILWRIILPLSKASIATIGLFYAVGHWNAWFDAMLYMSDKSNWTLQYVLRQVLSSASASELVKDFTDATAMPPTEMVRMATIMAATVPILFVYPFLQKHFVKGVMVGSVKG